MKPNYLIIGIIGIIQVDLNGQVRGFPVSDKVFVTDSEAAKQQVLDTWTRACWTSAQIAPRTRWHTDSLVRVYVL